MYKYIHKFYQTIKTSSRLYALIFVLTIQDVLKTLCIAIVFLESDGEQVTVITPGLIAVQVSFGLLFLFIPIAYVIQFDMCIDTLYII